MSLCSFHLAIPAVIPYLRALVDFLVELTPKVTAFEPAIVLT